MIGEESSSEGYEWQPISNEIPGKNDFGEGLDERSAYKEFGGLTLDEAYQRFIENPVSCQEDFMFMGPVAFCYYFPVVERYLYAFRVENEWEDSQAWIS
jgi:hypothetical protein